MENKQEHWKKELDRGEHFLKSFKHDARIISNIFLPKSNEDVKFKYNLFNSNVNVLHTAMFARVPQPTVSRRFADSTNQVARVSSLILERAVYFDLTANDSFRMAIKQALTDYLTVGVGWLYATYNANVENPQIPVNSEDSDIADSIVIKNQHCATQYINWKDVVYSPARSWDEVCWIARRVYFDEEDFTERFGTNHDISFDKDETDDENSSVEDGSCAVWEIWCKDEQKVFYIIEELDYVLEEIDDPYGLPDFFPIVPIVANTVNDSFIPIADFKLLEFQYRELEDVNERINQIAGAIRVAGLYDGAIQQIPQLVSSQENGVLIPVDHWDNLQNTGGLNRHIEFLDMTAPASVLQQLHVNKQDLMTQIETISGISDVIRGAGGNQYESAAATRLKSQYSNLRLSSKSTVLAEACTYIIKCYAHFICSFYTVNEILKRTGDLQAHEQQYLEQALQLLANEELRMWNIEVSSDSLKAADFDKDISERSAVLQQVSTLIPQLLQVQERVPELGGMALELMRYALAGTRGAREIEGLVDAALQQFQAAQAQKLANPEPKKPDPAELQVQAQIQMNQLSQQTELQKAQMNVELEKMKLEQQFQLKQFELQIKQAELENERAKLQLEQAKIQINKDLEEARIIIETQKVKQNNEHFLMQLQDTEIAHQPKIEIAQLPDIPTQVVMSDIQRGDPLADSMPEKL